MDDSTTKRCTRCGVDKPLTEFHKNRQNKDGLHSWCKVCFHAHVYKDPDRRKRKLDYNQQRYQRLSDQICADERERYNSDPNYRAHRLAYEATRHRTDSDYRERRRAQNRKDKSTPQGRMRSRMDSHKRRVQKRDGGNYTVTEWNELCTRYNHLCVCCGKRKPLTVDHIKPLSKGGLNTIDNIQPLCLNCNVQKNARTIDYRY